MRDIERDLEWLVAALAVIFVDALVIESAFTVRCIVQMPAVWAFGAFVAVSVLGLCGLERCHKYVLVKCVESKCRQ